MMALESPRKAEVLLLQIQTEVICESLLLGERRYIWVTSAHQLLQLYHRVQADNH